MEKLFSEEELRAIVDETLNAEYTLEEVIAQREEDLKIRLRERFKSVTFTLAQKNVHRSLTICTRSKFLQKIKI